MICKFNRGCARAAFGAINGYKIKLDTRFGHGLYDCNKFPWVPDTKFYTNWFAAREIAQAFCEFKKLSGSAKLRMAVWRDDIREGFNTSGFSNFWCYF